MGTVDIQDVQYADDLTQVDESMGDLLFTMDTFDRACTR